ncbi:MULTISPECIES: hypothetical protein [unclassified Duganella]|uniref:hypothetical protein n=1 Tax=unclassified Duganella TaxID=2636909 RepID=UPI000B7D1A07|nr:MULTISPECIES: hypothetical protein [unclassified Duganella]
MTRENEKVWERRSLVCFVLAVVVGVFVTALGAKLGWSERAAMIPGLVLAAIAVICVVIPIMTADE